jgi:hypothetical protein
MVDLHKIMSKRMWFLLFNLGTIIYMIVTGSLSWDIVTIASFVFALLLINGIAWISARKYKEWK